MSAEIESSGEQDILDEDNTRNEDMRAAGFIGKASEIKWRRKLHGVEPADTHRGPWGLSGDESAVDSRSEARQTNLSSHTIRSLLPPSKLNFYLDDELFEPDAVVDPLEMPSFEIAERLLQAYMQSTQNSFPFLAKKVFVDRFYHCTFAEAAWTSLVRVPLTQLCLDTARCYPVRSL